MLERLAYLNAGTFGPLARATLDAIAEQQRRDGEEGRMGTAYFERMLALRASVREKLAAVVGVAPDRVALVTRPRRPSTSSSTGWASARTTRWSPPTPSTSGSSAA